jgi:Flp pilus assembly protein TadD
MIVKSNYSSSPSFDRKSDPIQVKIQLASDNHVASLDWKGIIIGMNGDYKEAISYFDKALKIEPKNRRVLKNREFALKNLKEQLTIP